MRGMKPIINQIVGEMRAEYENGVMRAVQSVGFDVDKDRLTQALSDASRFYMEGYNDAMTNHNLAEVVRCKDCKHCQKDMFFGTAFCYGREVRPNHFCSYGERRDTDA